MHVSSKLRDIVVMI